MSPSGQLAALLCNNMGLASNGSSENFIGSLLSAGNVLVMPIAAPGEMGVQCQRPIRLFELLASQAASKRGASPSEVKSKFSMSSDRTGGAAGSPLQRWI